MAKNLVTLRSEGGSIFLREGVQKPFTTPVQLTGGFVEIELNPGVNPETIEYFLEMSIIGDGYYHSGSEGHGVSFGKKENFPSKDGKNRPWVSINYWPTGLIDGDPRGNVIPCHNRFRADFS